MFSSKPKRKAASLSGQVAFLMAAAAGLLLIDLVVTNSQWAVGAVLIGSIALASIVWPQLFTRCRQQLSFLSRRYGVVKIAMITIATLFIIHSLTEPASAVFFSGAEEWLKTNLTKDLATSAAGGTGNNPAAIKALISLTFNVLRGLFLLYVGIAIVKVVNAARQDEDWQNLARQPLIIVIAVTMGDALAGIIVTP